MALPLYLAMTAAEISSSDILPGRCAYMACHFSPYTQGLSNIPDALPPGSVLIVNDRLPCQGHSPDLVTGQLEYAVARLHCESVLLDFQRPPDSESETMISKIVRSLPCPVAVTEGFARNVGCAVFLSPAPLHIPLPNQLDPWHDREIWLEATLGQECIAITNQGACIASQFPPDGLSEGFYEEALCCHYRTEVDRNKILFTLFETPESLVKKLTFAASLGVTRAIGLWQELGTFQTGTEHDRCSIAPTEKPC